MTTPLVPLPVLTVTGLSKCFELHQQAVTRWVFKDACFQIASGECLALEGRSGSGKSSLLRTIYGNYAATSGHIHIYDAGKRTDITVADPWTLIMLRRRTIGYVGQFLKVLPRISALDIVSEPLVQEGVEDEIAHRAAAVMLERLGIDQSLWPLSPTTFSGGEQQRVNIARAFIRQFPLMLIDEPTASLDAENTAVVIDIVREALAAGTAILGIFHDQVANRALASRSFNVEACTMNPHAGICHQQVA